MTYIGFLRIFSITLLYVKDLNKGCMYSSVPRLIVSWEKEYELWSDFSKGSSLVLARIVRNNFHQTYFITGARNVSPDQNAPQKA